MVNGSLSRIILAVGAVFALGESSASAATYEGPGPVAASEVDAQRPQLRVVKPDAAGAYPLIVASHGFGGSGDTQIGWARHFASWGFVVAVPTFDAPFAPNAEEDATTIAAIVDHLTSKAATFDVVGTKVGLEGHSAGALTSVVAAGKVPANAVVLFDPVDRDGVGQKALGTTCAPILTVLAEADACNNAAGWAAFASTGTGARTTFRVAGSSHCDGENTSRGALCAVFCQSSAADEARQKTYAHYATAFFLARLKDDAAAAAVLTEASLGGDARLSNPTVKPTACAEDASADAETPPTKTPSDAPRAGSDAAPAEDASPPASSAENASDGGCHVGSESSAQHLSAIALAVGGAVLLGRWRARRRRGSSARR